MMSEFKDYLNRCDFGIHAIKLRTILDFHRDRFGFRSIKIVMPPTEIGSVTLVDQVLLMLLVDICNPKVILEIGTFQGYATRMFLENTNLETRVFSVDLPKSPGVSEQFFEQSRALYDGDYNDKYLTNSRNVNGEVYLSDLEESLAKRLTLIKQNSKTINYKTFGPIDFAFIDGGHDIDTVLADTTLVREAMKKGFIVWHDFGSSIHCGVTDFLEQEKNSRSIYHVAGSLCAFEIIDI